MIWIWPKTLNLIFQDRLLTAAGQHSGLAWQSLLLSPPVSLPSLGPRKCPPANSCWRQADRPGRDRWPHLRLSGASSNNCPQAGRGAVGQKDKNRDGAGAGLGWEGEAGSVGKACWAALSGRGLAPLRDQLPPLSISESTTILLKTTPPATEGVFLNP